MNRRMTQDLAHKRPYLLASLIAGISFPATWLFLPLEGGLIALVWKMAAVGLLVPFALHRHHVGEFVPLAIILAFYALGDGLIEFSMVAGALAFAAGHLVAIEVEVDTLAQFREALDAGANAVLLDNMDPETLRALFGQ